jgi:hypothetical protein
MARIGLMAVAAAGAAWLTISVAAAQLLRGRPEAALRLAPYDARAKVVLAARALGDGRIRPDFQTTQRFAREALQRDPTVVAAWRMLGLVESGRQNLPEARRMFHISERFSRRDLPTQLWLIEENVARNDVEAAVRHYDIALRTAPASGDLLLPILVSATAYPHIVEALAPVLANNPPWAGDFYAELSRAVPSASGAAALIEAMRRRGPLVHEMEIRRLISVLVEKGEFAAAWRVYRAAAPRDRGQAALRNGGFESRDRMPVFEWELQNGVDLRAEVRPSDRGDGASVLFAHASGENLGVVARQMLVLGPGSYELGTVAGMDSPPAPTRLRWNVKCAGSDAVLLDLDLSPQQPGRRLHRAVFRVPPGNCRAQWLSLEIEADDSADGAEAWVDSVVVRPTMR